MRRWRIRPGAVAVVFLFAAACGCVSPSQVLYSISTDPRESGRQWVWPHFMEAKPTVLVFWSTNEMQCERDIPALKTLDRRSGSVQLVTVVTGRDRVEIEKWLYRDKIDYVVLLDLEEQLASRLGVHDYPTFLYFDTSAAEIGRGTDIRVVHNWFDRPRWLEKSGAVEPAAARRAPVE